MYRLSTFFLTSLFFTSACVVGDGEAEDDDLLIAGATTAAIRIVSHNIEKKQAVLEKTLAEARQIDANGIALQEVCPSQLAWLKANYSGKWTIGSVPGKRPALSGCELPDGTHDYPADVVIWRGGTGGNVTAYPALGGPANAPGNKMVCVRFERAKVPVHFCSTHLISADWVDPATGTMFDGEAVREQQTTGIKRIARENWFDGTKNHFAIVAGDFNGQPNSPPMDKMYDGKLGGTGDFTEYNRTGGSRLGQDTAHADGSNTLSGEPYSKKIDYIFFSTNRAPMDGPAVQITPDASDHDMLVSTVHMRK